RYVIPQNGGQQYARPQNPALPQRPMSQKPKAPVKMPKERAMALANRFKRGLAIASLVGFGTFGGLVALHEVGTTTSQSTQSTHTSSGSSSTNSSNSSSSSSSQSSNSFLNQQGGNTSGTSNSSSNGSSTSSSSSSTVTGTHTS
ncbi:MAG TPA: hypothetical protein VJO32_04225, partial [Ktedonobacteraceae bacterium]|nr:hypothetical protein [Ktedonobacteraceae bacterium]